MAAVFGAVLGTAWLVNKHFANQREAMAREHMNAESTDVGTEVDGSAIASQDLPAQQSYGSLFNPTNKFDGRDDFLATAQSPALPSASQPQASGRRSTFWMPRSEGGLERDPDNYTVGNNQLSVAPAYTKSITQDFQVNTWKPDTHDPEQTHGANGLEADVRVLPHEGLLQDFMANMRQSRNEDYQVHTVRNVEQQGRATATGSFQWAPPGRSGAANDFETKRKNAYGIAPAQITAVERSAFTLPVDVGQRLGKDRVYNARNDLANMGSMFLPGATPIGNDSRRDRSEYRLFTGTRESDPKSTQITTTGLPIGGVGNVGTITRKSDGVEGAPRSFFKSEMGALIPYTEGTVRRAPDDPNPRREFGRFQYEAASFQPRTTRYTARGEMADRSPIIPPLQNVAPHVSGLHPAATQRGGALRGRSTNFN